MQDTTASSGVIEGDSKEKNTSFYDQETAQANNDAAMKIEDAESDEDDDAEEEKTAGEESDISEAENKNLVEDRMPDVTEEQHISPKKANKEVKPDGKVETSFIAYPHALDNTVRLLMQCKNV